MNINITRWYETCNFKRLSVLEMGKFFLYNSNVYVKTRHFLFSRDKCECLQFGNSMYCEPVYLDVNTQVAPCNVLDLKYYVPES